MQYGNTALHFAASGGRDGVVALLLDHGADINQQVPADNTLVHFIHRLRRLQI